MLNKIILHFSLKPGFWKIKNLGIVIKEFSKFWFDAYQTKTYVTIQFIPGKKKKSLFQRLMVSFVSI